MKIPKNGIPKITYNEQKLRIAQEKNDGKKSDDELMLERLEEYFKERDLTFCDYYYQIGKMELANIKKADEKYPDYGTNHSKYIDKLNAQEKAKLNKKHNINDTINKYVGVFGYSYCE